MVSKSFILVKCACGAHKKKRRDINRAKRTKREEQTKIVECPHFKVLFDCKTENRSNPKKDHIRIRLNGICKRCNHMLTAAQSKAKGYSTPDHNGTLNCLSCGSKIGWAVSHCAHSGLKILGWTALAAIGGVITGGGLAALTAGPIVGTSISSAIVSGGSTLAANINSSGNSGMRVSSTISSKKPQTTASIVNLGTETSTSDKATTYIVNPGTETSTSDKATTDNVNPGTETSTSDNNKRKPTFMEKWRAARAYIDALNDFPPTYTDLNHSDVTQLVADPISTDEYRLKHDAVTKSHHAFAEIMDRAKDSSLCNPTTEQELKDAAKHIVTVGVAKSIEVKIDKIRSNL